MLLKKIFFLVLIKMCVCVGGRGGGLELYCCTDLGAHSSQFSNLSHAVFCRSIQLEIRRNWKAS